MVDLEAKKLRVIGVQDKLNLLKSEVHMRLSNNFFYRVSLGKRVYRHVKSEDTALLAIQERFNLETCKVEYDNMSLLLEGRPDAIEKALNHTMHLMESLSVGQ